MDIFFLPKPPEFKLHIPDFRTKNNRQISELSNLLATIFDVQRKQNWLRDQKIFKEEEKIIKGIKELLEIEKIKRENKTFENFLQSLIQRLDEKEFIVIRNGVVGNNIRRSLNVEEFKDFVLFDEYAPTIFINGKDYKSSQIFTLILELVYLYLNER